MKYDIYLAAPFFSAGELLHNNNVLEELERAGLRVFYPARDGIVAKDEIARGNSTEKVFSAVWRCDTEAILNSGAILAILDGRVVDEGVCVELGYASALNKLVIGFQTDQRSCFPWGSNPMVVQAITIHTTSLTEAIDAIQARVSDWRTN